MRSWPEGVVLVARLEIVAERTIVCSIGVNRQQIIVYYMHEKIIDISLVLMAWFDFNKLFYLILFGYVEVIGSWSAILEIWLC